MSVWLFVLGFLLLLAATVAWLIYHGWREEPPDDFWES